MVRAKFVCTSVTIQNTTYYDAASAKYVPAVLKSYRFQPVTGTSEENKLFFASTPTGTCELGTVNPAVEFECGQEYYLDFSLAPVAAS